MKTATGKKEDTGIGLADGRLLGGLLLFLLAGCGNGGGEDPCAGVTCSDHGECAVASGRAVCVCDSGFHAAGLECAPDGASDADADGDGIDVRPDEDVDGDGCIPASCGDLGRQCGETGNGCGGTLDCGTCGAGAMCNADGQCVPLPPAGAPVLFFTDLESGPKTGWEGTSERGAAVSVWGRNFGPSRGSSTVAIGGVALSSDDDYAEWGVMGPSRGLERLTFMVPAAAPDGDVEITVTVGGETSNPLPFTVRTGDLYYVTTGGDDDSGDGSWASPWRSVYQAAQEIAPGDVAYIGDGVQDIVEAGMYGGCVDLTSDGEPGRPKALVAYPGATVTVGNPDLGRAFASWVGGRNERAEHWVIAKMNIVAASDGVAMRSGFRVVGNRFTGPNGDGQTGIVEGYGDRLRVLGNEFYDVGHPDATKLYHVVYLSGLRTQDPPRAPTEGDREVGWNWFHDCLANRALDIYSEQAQSAFIEGHIVHDNLIENQRGDGILIGYYITGYNAVYNNVIVNAGLGPTWPDDASTHLGIRISAGHEESPGTVVEVYNNTVVGCGWSGQDWGSGNFWFDPDAAARGVTVDLRNNIFVSTELQNIGNDSADLLPDDYANLFHGDSAGTPSWDTAAVTGDPLFAASPDDMHLQAGSPAIDSGSADVAGVAPMDKDGVPRPQGDGFDIGAYEFIP